MTATNPSPPDAGMERAVEATRQAFGHEYATFGEIAIRALMETPAPPDPLLVALAMATKLHEKFGAQCDMPEVATWVPIARAAIALAEAGR